MDDVAARLAEVQGRIHAAAVKAGREAEEITLVAVTKGIPVARIREGIAVGLTDIGENRVQEAREKAGILGTESLPVRRHMLGHLQSNKVNPALELFDLIQSLDRRSLAEALSRRATRSDRTVDVLVQVNVAGETTKQGLAVAEVLPFLQEVGVLPGLRPVGLMTIAPWAEDPEDVRPYFRSLRELWEQARDAHIPGVDLHYLSMGMSNDYQVAVEEGANMVRIGTAIFGSRA